MGYVVNFDTYSEREPSVDKEIMVEERVFRKLVTHILPIESIFLCFDQFFTSLKISELPFAATDTCIRSRKNVPTLDNKKTKKRRI